MRTNKNGTRAIPKLVWVEMAELHCQFADELGKLIADALDSARREIVTAKYADASTGEIDTAERLHELRKKHVRPGRACVELANRTKRGAPKKRAPTPRKRTVFMSRLSRYTNIRRQHRHRAN